MCMPRITRQIDVLGELAASETSDREIVLEKSALRNVFSRISE